MVVVIKYFNEILVKFGNWLLSVLPTSPFMGFIDNFKTQFSPYLGWLNWCIPIKDFVAIFSVWLGAVLLFYGYSIIMRWVKMI